MQIKKRIGLIGAGNMGSAILEGLFKKKLTSGNRVWIYDKFPSKVSGFAGKWKVHRCRSLDDLLKAADIVLLAVKPQDLRDVGRELKESPRKAILISILAGTPIVKIRKYVGSRFSIIRAMPNLGAKVGESVTAITGSDAGALALAEAIFLGCGKVLRLKERHFDLVTALSGSGPAYFFLLMEFLAGFGESWGLSQKNAGLLAVQTAIGAGLLARTGSLPPKKLREMVTSKKGTTEAALKKLYAAGLPKIFDQALRAAWKRGRELSRM